MADKKISALTAATTPLTGTEVLPIVQGSATVKVTVDNLTAGKVVSVGSLSSAGEVVAGTGLEALRIRGLVGSVNNFALYAGNLTPSATNYTLQANYLGGYPVLNATAGTFAIISVGDVGVAIFDTPGIKAVAGNFIQGTAGKGVNFTANTPAAGMTSQLLNWYEQGTFTPVVADAATGGNTGTAGLAKGRYTRVGRSITVSISFLDITTTGMTAGNNLFVRGLPFVSVTDAFVNFVGSQANSQLASTNGAIYPVLGNNSSAIYFLDGIAAGSNTPIKVSAITSGQTDLYITMTYEAA